MIQLTKNELKFLKENNELVDQELEVAISNGGFLEEEKVRVPSKKIANIINIRMKSTNYKNLNK